MWIPKDSCGGWLMILAPLSAAAVTITLDAEGRVYLDAEPIEKTALIAALRATLADQPDAKINIAADTACPAGDLLGVIDQLSEAGLGAFQLFGTPGETGPSGEAPPG